MRDGDFECFIADFGEGIHRRAVPQSAIDTWRGRLPDQLLTYWQHEGWCGYRDGLLWTVDPANYEDLVAEWLADTPFAAIDRFHAFARSAFGKLYVFGERTKSDITISCPFHGIIAMKGMFNRALLAKEMLQYALSLAPVCRTSSTSMM